CRALTTSTSCAPTPARAGRRRCAHTRRRFHLPLPWFRRKQRQSTATIATPFTELAPEELPLNEKEAPSTPTVTAEPEPGDQAAKSNRRRGGRGGRNRRK